jgi:RHS repeat-associated protein
LIRTYSYVYDSTWKDKLTGYDGKTITYDAIGNPLTYDGWTFTWDGGRQLAGLSRPGQTITYKYNDAGIRTEKTVNGITTKYHLVDGRVTYETNNSSVSDSIYYTYDAGGNLVSMNLNGAEYYYIRNGQGDIMVLIDNTGTQVVSYTYDTWGRLLSISGPLASSVGLKNPYRYRGYRYDEETGLYYLQSRYYNPECGKFINADALLGETGDLLGHNLFAYCENNLVLCFYEVRTKTL